jgi:hypothetical protein
MSSGGEDNFVKGLRFIAAALNSTTTVQCDAFRYDAITESTIWEDELPPVIRARSEALWGIRPILRHRASIILGEPDPEWERCWQLGKELFPNWVGFIDSRVDPAPEIREFLRQRVVETRSAISRMISNAVRRGAK